MPAYPAQIPTRLITVADDGFITSEAIAVTFSVTGAGTVDFTDRHGDISTLHYETGTYTVPFLGCRVVKSQGATITGNIGVWTASAAPGSRGKFLLDDNSKILWDDSSVALLAD